MVNYYEAIKMIGEESANIYNNIGKVCPDIHNPYVRIYYKCGLEEELSINLGTTEIFLAHAVLLGICINQDRRGGYLKHYFKGSNLCQ